MQSARTASKTGGKDESLESSAWSNISNTYKTVYAYINSDLRQYGLTQPQYAAMRAVGASQSQRITMSEIGKKLIVTFANITTIVDNLEKRGYVKRVRDSDDRRVILVELTWAGSKLFKKIRAAHVKQISKLMKVLNEDELNTLSGYMERIRENVQENP